MGSFAAPNEVASRTQMTTELAWDATVGSIKSPGPLDDNNVWLLGFTVGQFNHGMLSSVEDGGGVVKRNAQLIRNADGVALYSATDNEPGVGFTPQVGQAKSRRRHVVLAVGERYTFAIWNDQPSQSSPMIAQLYLS